MATRVALKAARKYRNATALKYAQHLAGAHKEANAAVYYVATRYFGGSDIGLDTAAAAARHCDISPAGFLASFLDESDLDVSNIQNRMDGLVARVGGWGATGAPMSRAFSYAQKMLDGDYTAAFKLWSAFPETQEALRRLTEDEGDAGALTSTARIARNTRLAVVLPGTTDVDQSAEIDGHDIVARTAMPSGSSPNTGSRTDLVFLNLDRMRQLQDIPNTVRCVITKKTAPKDRPVIEPSLRSRVAFELDAPPAPAAPTTYLALFIAQWAIRALDQSAVFYCADFYLGARSYNVSNYDTKKFISDLGGVRRSYICHDVFFVHAVLRFWWLRRRIAARGRLAELLDTAGEDFASLMQARWGPAAGHQPS